MQQFKHVTVVKAANIYHGGKVTSRTVLFDDGSKKTLGIMLPGEYSFGTDAPELMEILSGEMEILLPGESVWRSIKGGESFNVPGNARFELKVHSVSDYYCSYL
ncbi:MAG: pyrimidine/purine nucleoside phosphorylase [Campylobacterales bacterium]|nr:pyrimidine/purine nucleoside phosphorylase [Campylobacterales bacterium]